MSNPQQGGSETPKTAAPVTPQQQNQTPGNPQNPQQQNQSPGTAKPAEQKPNNSRSKPFDSASQSPVKC